MSRYVFSSAIALLACSLGVSSALAQAKAAPPPAQATTAAPAAPAPAAKAKWVPPVKGVATLDLLQTPSKVMGKEIVTILKMKNTSTGSINLLKVDQLWYDKARKLISSATSYYRKPFLPGEIIELELRAPLNGQPDVNQMTFAHANGKVNATKVKKLE